TANPASFDVSRVGMQVVDPDPDHPSKPTFGVGGFHSPAGGNNTASPADPNRYMNLDVQATSAGAPLYYAEAYFEDNPATLQRGYFNPGCVDLTPATPTVLDLSLDACTTTGKAAIKQVDAGVMSNGFHNLIVRVVDVFGHSSSTSQSIEVLNNVDLGTATRTLSIGTSGINSPQGTTNNNNGG